MKTRIGRPRKGKQVSNVVSIRMEPKAKALIIKNYGSVQSWVDGLLCLLGGSPDETAT